MLAVRALGQHLCVCVRACAKRLPRLVGVLPPPFATPTASPPTMAVRIYNGQKIATTTAAAAAGAATSSSLSPHGRNRLRPLLGGGLSMYPRGMDSHARPEPQHALSGLGRVGGRTALQLQQEFEVLALSADQERARLVRQAARHQAQLVLPGTLASPYRRFAPGQLLPGRAGRFLGVSFDGPPEVWVPRLWAYVAPLALAHGVYPSWRAMDLMRRLPWTLRDALPTAEGAATEAFLLTHPLDAPWYAQELHKTVVPIRNAEGLYWFWWTLLRTVFPSVSIPWQLANDGGGRR